MKDALDRYVRSLAEREHAHEAPETMQDLGTFLDWLLERQGYQVLLRAYKHVGPERRKSSGRLQLGVDTLATRVADDGTQRLFRFVLKAGPIGITEWGAADTRGSMVHDLHLAAGKDPDRELEDHGISAEPPVEVVVVAVHNGDFDAESLGGSRHQLKKLLERHYSVGLEWWDASRLVALALEPSAANASGGMESPDATLLPPAVRPFARLAIDSLRIGRGSQYFDLLAFERYLEAKLPLNRTLDEDTDRVVLMEGEAMSGLSLYRSIAELEVVGEMLIAESSALDGGNTLPALDSLERMLLRAIEHLRRCPDADMRKLRSRIEESVDAIVARYVELVEVLCARLDPLLLGENSLALPSGAEPVNYPLRVLRFAGYLATAGIAILDRDGHGDRSESMAWCLARLWATNRCACEGPVTDDQVIEHALIWEFLLRAGKQGVVKLMADAVLERCLARRAVGWPLPALHQRARVSLTHRDARDLVEGFIGGQYDIIEDEGSTLIPLALYVAARLGTVEDHVLSTLQYTQRTKKQCVLQAWRCRSNGPDEWYAHELHHNGATYVFGYLPPEMRGAAPGLGVGTIDEFVGAFESFARVPNKSAAQRWKQPVIDRMAFKVFRTRPPMQLFTELLREESNKP